MVIDLKDIKSLRKKVNLTQKQLAEISGVSQSLVTKIESGSIDPSYSNARKLINALNSISLSSEKNAEGMMEKQIRSVCPDDDIGRAIKLMKKHEISQIPVLDGNKPVGYISESIILDAIMDNKHTKVSQIMKETPPILSRNASIDVISYLLKFYQMLLVAEKGKIIGIITRADMIRKI